jgi:hypothetical protein
MHQEQNIAKSIMSMCLDVTSFTKDNVNARKSISNMSLDVTNHIEVSKPLCGKHKMSS